MGRKVAEAIARMLPESRLRWLHTRADDESLIVEIAGGAALVPPLSDPEDLAGSSAVVVTVPPCDAAARRILDWLGDNPDAVLLDCSQPGVARQESRRVLHRLPPPESTHRWYHLADPALAAPVRLLEAVAPLQPRELHLTLMCPVAGLGEEALDELARQGAARLSGQPVPKPIQLPATLAFDLAPASSERAAELEAQLRELLPDLEHRVHLVDAGVFHGFLATLLVRCGTAPTEARLRGLVRAAHGFRLTKRDEIPTTTRAVEYGSTITCGGLRVAGDWTSGWLLADGLAVGASAALEIVRSLSAC
jgi:hypothetical protein